MMSQKAFHVILFTCISALALWISLGLHVHMDEFISFHPLAYGQPNFHLNTFNEGFQAYIKKGPWGISAYVPFPYIGNLQAFLFYPFYVTLPLIVAKVSYSIISLYVIFWSFFRCFKPNRSGQVFLVLFLPMYMAVCHDGGPVNVTIIIFLWTKIWVEKLYGNNNASFKFGISCLIVFAWCLAFYDKIFFIYLWPAALVFSFTRIGFSKLRSRSTFYLGSAMGIFFLFVIIFMRYEICATDFNSPNLTKLCLPESQFLGFGDGAAVMIFIKKMYHGHFSLAPLHEIFIDRKNVYGNILYQFDYSFYLLRNVDYFSFLQVKIFGFLPIFAWIFVGTGLVFFFKRPRFYLQNTYLISFFVMALVFMALGKIRFYHHTIFLWIPLLGFLLDGPTPPFRNKILIGLFVANSALLIWNIAFGMPNEFIKEGYDKIARGTQRKEIPRAIVNFDSWNYYYIRSLDNDRNDIVTWVTSDKEIASKRLFALSDSLHLPIVYVGSNQKPIPLPKGFSKRLLVASKNNPIYLISNSGVQK